MRKCIVFFAILVLSLVLAIITDDTNRDTPMDEVTIEENSLEGLLAIEQDMEEE